MKDFMMLCAVVCILFFFPLQFALNQINHNKMATVQNIVHKSAQRARTDGYFTQANIDNLKKDIKNAFPNVLDSDISVTTSPGMKYRKNNFDQREMIAYEIGVPIDKIIAMPNYFSISDSDNKTTYKVRGEVPSEVLMP